MLLHEVIELFKDVTGSKQITLSMKAERGCNFLIYVQFCLKKHSSCLYVIHFLLIYALSWCCVEVCFKVD